MNLRLTAFRLARGSALGCTRVTPSHILHGRPFAFSLVKGMSDLTKSPQAKKRKMEPKIIGTHNGTFHCDEALAVFMLRLTGVYRDAALKRSRDPAILDTCDIVVDVGAIYDESKQRFDHHQREFNEVFGYGFVTKLSSAGLVYKHFGKEIIASRIQAELGEGDPKVETLWLKMYKEFIESIDANDNGISQYPTDIQPRYRVTTSLPSRVASLNPAWNQPLDADAIDAQFEKASQLTGGEFLSKLDYYANAWMPARDIVAAALANSASVHPSEQIVVFEQFAPWKEHLFELETSPKAIYVVYPDEFGGNWRIQAVPVSPESFDSRKALPEKWRGVRDEELSGLTGIEGCIFVHASGFIGGNKTKEGVMKMAHAALEI